MADKSYLAVYDHKHDRLLTNITIIDVCEDEVETGYWQEHWEPVLTIYELGVVLNYIKETHPNGWMIDNDKVIDASLVTENINSPIKVDDNNE